MNKPYSDLMIGIGLLLFPYPMLVYIMLVQI